MDHRGLRSANRAIILHAIRQHDGISRAELSRVTGLTRSTVSEVVSDLLERRLVFEDGMIGGRPGRRSIRLRYFAQSQAVMGFDIGGTNVIAAVGNLEGEVLASRQWPLPTLQTAPEMLDWLAARARELAEACGNSMPLACIGVGTPGLVDTAGGRVLGASPNLPEWEDLPLAEELEQRLHVPVEIENDVNVALLGELRSGAARGHANTALFLVGTGIGGALAFGGQLYRGSNGGAGELGYWLLGREHLEQDWTPHGCLESLASGWGVAQKAAERCPDLQPASAEAVFAAARDGHAAAKALVAEVADWMALATANLASLLDLDCVLIGGGVARSADLLIHRIRETVYRHTPMRPLITLTDLGELSGVHGAVQMAADAALVRLLESPSEVHA